MDFNQIVKAVERGNLTPKEISDYRLYCAGILARKNVEYGELCAYRAKWIVANQEKHKSHASCERAFEAEEKGQRTIALKYQIRSIEAVSDALTNAWFVLQSEIKNIT